MRIITLLATVGSVLLVGFAALQRQAAQARAVTNSTAANASADTVTTVLQTASQGLAISMAPALMAAFVAAGVALLALVGGGR